MLNARFRSASCSTGTGPKSPGWRLASYKPRVTIRVILRVTIRVILRATKRATIRVTIRVTIIRVSIIRVTNIRVTIRATVRVRFIHQRYRGVVFKVVVVVVASEGLLLRIKMLGLVQGSTQSDVSRGRFSKRYHRPCVKSLAFSVGPMPRCMWIARTAHTTTPAPCFNYTLYASCRPKP